MFHQVFLHCSGGDNVVPRFSCYKMMKMEVQQRQTVHETGAYGGIICKFSLMTFYYVSGHKKGIVKGASSIQAETLILY